MTPTQREAALRLADDMNTPISVWAEHVAHLLRELAAEPVQEPVHGCPRIDLVVAIHGLASHFENSLYAFRDDAEALLKAKRDIAWARKTAAKHNQNGPGCYAAPQQLQPLTDEQIDAVTRELWGQLLGSMMVAHRAFARAIEAAHGIGEAP